mmetsp:Transcript_128583/g.222107  ORF Transcript_128583/g.222107 Transcript_128583/m.222107 type:complete len:225 (-) Transcript_128583:762-1436(-)
MVGLQPAGASQNVGNVLGARPCVRQTKNYRKYESGNNMKAIMGHDQLMWDVNRQQGVWDTPNIDEGPRSFQQERPIGGFQYSCAAPGAHGHRPGPHAASQTPVTPVVDDTDNAGRFHPQAMEVHLQDAPCPPAVRLGPDQTHNPSVGRCHLLDGQWAAAAAARRRNIMNAEHWTGVSMTDVRLPMNITPRTLQVGSFRLPAHVWECDRSAGPSLGQRTFYKESW